MGRAVHYDEQFVKVFPFNWEMHVLTKYLASAKTLLDVGCGTGRHIVSLAERGSSILGIDKDKEYVEAARKKLKFKGLASGVNLIIADARFLPFRRRLFDAVLCMGNVLGDVDIHKKDRVAILQGMMYTAKSKAIFIIELEHRYWRPTDLLIWLYRYLATSVKKLIEKSLEYGDYTETIQFHHKVKLTFHAFTTREAKQLFESQGFQSRIEKRAKFFYDWFILVATRKTQS
mgnify:CR=1 FL=1